MKPRRRDGSRSALGSPLLRRCWRTVSNGTLRDGLFMILCFYLYYLVHCGPGCAAVARSRAYVLRMLPYTRHPSRKPASFFPSVIPNDPRPIFQSNVSLDHLPLLCTYHTRVLYLGYVRIQRTRFDLRALFPTRASRVRDSSDALERRAKHHSCFSTPRLVILTGQQTPVVTSTR